MESDDDVRRVSTDKNDATKYKCEIRNHKMKTDFQIDRE